MQSLVKAKNGILTYLKNIDEADKALSEGFDIAILDDENDTLTTVAKPGAGWIEPKPDISNTRTCTAKAAAADYVAAAFSILVYGEEGEHGDTDAGA